MSIIRDKKTSKPQFKYSLDIISHILALDVLSEASLTKVTVETPFRKIRGSAIKERIVLLPILRAGLGLLEGFMYFVPDASIGHVGVYRDEKSLKPVPYYFRFPKFKKGEDIMVIILDPMIATGGSAVYVINRLLEMGIRKIRLASVIAAPEGVKRITEGIKAKNLKKFEMVTCCLDECLNDKGFIMPGLGDAGDRLYGT
jgi:uracil phosphoribosyltransferase